VLEAGPNREVVGTAGAGLRRLRVGGASITAGLASDFAVDQEHRVLRPALMLARAVLAALDDGLGAVYGMPNAKALPIFRHLRYDTSTVLTRHVKVLGVERFLNDMPGPRLGRRLVAGVVDPVLRVTSPETWRPRHGRTVARVETFDQRFDALWERTRDSFEVACERTSEFLTWRYARCPLAKYVTLALAERDERLSGYAVCTVGSDRQVRVIDLWAGADEQARDDLLAGLLSWSRSQGAASVACEEAGVKDVRDSLVRFGFRERSHGTTLVISPPGEKSQRLEPHRWYFLLADEDYN
jgi:hypothetical protein